MLLYKYDYYCCVFLQLNNWTALHLAAEAGHYNVVAWLLSHGARVNDGDYVS